MKKFNLQIQTEFQSKLLQHSNTLPTIKPPYESPQFNVLKTIPISPLSIMSNKSKTRTNSFGIMKLTQPKKQISPSPLNERVGSLQFQHTHQTLRDLYIYALKRVDMGPRTTNYTLYTTKEKELIKTQTSKDEILENRTLLTDRFRQKSFQSSPLMKNSRSKRKVIQSEYKQNETELYIILVDSHFPRASIVTSLPKSLYKLANHESIYKNREMLFQRLWLQLKVDSSFKYLFLPEENPIQFFQEIPTLCRFLILQAKNQNNNIWIKICNQHQKLQMDEAKQLIIKAIQDAKSISEIRSILAGTKPSIYYRKMNQKAQLFKPNFQDTMRYYQKLNVENDYLKSPRQRQSDSKTNLRNNLILDAERKFDEEDDNADFSVRLTAITPNTLGRLLKQKPFRPAKEIKIQKEDYYRAVSKQYTLMINNNVPFWLRRTEFTRQEIHEVFSRFRALLLMECEDGTGSDIAAGIQFTSFLQGLQELSMAPLGVVRHLFNLFSVNNRLKFEGFLNAINLIRAKKNQGKIDLILKLMDENGNGSLSYTEIATRCHLMMNQILIDDQSELSIKRMGDYITRTIFKAVSMNQDEEIPIEKIRDLIETNSEEAQMLIMMCCGDVNYLK